MAFSIWYSVPYWAILALYMVLTIIEWRNSGDKRILQFIRIISTVAFLAFFGLRAYVGYDCHLYLFSKRDIQTTGVIHGTNPDSSVTLPWSSGSVATILYSYLSPPQLTLSF